MQEQIWNRNKGVWELQGSKAMGGSSTDRRCKTKKTLVWARTQCMQLSTWVLSSAYANQLQYISPDHQRKELGGQCWVQKGDTHNCTIPQFPTVAVRQEQDCSSLPSLAPFSFSFFPPLYLEYDRFLQRILLKLTKPVFSQKKIKQ